MNWGLGQSTEMKMNYEAKSVSLAPFIFSAPVSLISLFFSSILLNQQRIGAERSVGGISMCFCACLSVCRLLC